MDVLDELKAAVSDRYTLERELGSGGMATVYMAEDRRHSRKVAIKVLRADVAVAVGAERFLQEIQVAAHLQHPNILPLYDSGEGGGVPYYVMPYVAGETLADRIEREGQLPVEDAVQIAREVADALAHAHDHGVIHRDIKPQNILIEAGHAVVADFGIARAIGATTGEHMTSGGMAIGTPEYMSPEQADASEAIDGRSDIFSLGCVLFEMLIGEPPFTGRTADVVTAKRISTKPTPVRELRPSIPIHVEQVLQRTLERVPADRYRSAKDLLRELGTGPVSPPRQDDHRVRPTFARLRGAGVAIGALAMFGALVWRFFLYGPPPPLDPNRIVAFPLVVSGVPAQDAVVLGQDVAYLIVASLDGWASLKWQNGLDLLTEDRYVEAPHLLTNADKRDRTHEAGAAYFVEGRVILTDDSARVHLSLQSTDSDSVVARADTAGARADIRQLGVLGVGELLLALLPTGESVNVSAVAGRRTEAIQTFVQAERDFHRGRFTAAFERYSLAVDQDSTFALAALKAARAAAWSERSGQAVELIEVALRNDHLLLPRDVHVARGFSEFVQGQADTALHYFRQAIAIDSASPDAWMGVGEVFTHLIPQESPQDSLAEEAFREAFRQSGELAPVLYHLIEFAVRRGDVRRASRLIGELRSGRPDSSVLGIVELMLECVGETPQAVDWRAAVERDPGTVFNAAFYLGVGGAQPACADAAWKAVLAYDSAPSRRFSALIGLQSLLAARARSDELTALLDSAAATTPLLDGFYIYDAFALPDLRSQVAPAAERLGLELDRLADIRGSTSLSFLSALAAWYAHNGELQAARVIRDHVVSLAADNDSRHFDRLAQSVSAHVMLAEGDSTGAVQQFRALRPTARQQALAWRPWESLGIERLVLAEVLFARGEYEEARSVAADFDSPAVAPYLIYLPASLELRLRIAHQLGEEDTGRRLEERLRRLGREDRIP